MLLYGAGIAMMTTLFELSAAVVVDGINILHNLLREKVEDESFNLWALGKVWCESTSDRATFLHGRGRIRKGGEDCATTVKGSLHVTREGIPCGINSKKRL